MSPRRFNPSRLRPDGGAKRDPDETDRLIRLGLGALAVVVLLALIVVDATVFAHEIQPAHIYLLAALIWAFLGVRLLQSGGDGS